MGMKVEASVTVNADRETLWSVITDIKRAAEILNGVEAIKITERPSQGIIGIRWKETRLLRGKPATVSKWLSDVKDRESYTTRASDNGMAFVTTMRIRGKDGNLLLTGIHETKPQTFMARVMMIPMSLFFKGMIEKYVLQDLNDYKAAAERLTGEQVCTPKP